MVKASDAILVCRIMAADGKTSRVEVLSVLKGKSPERNLVLPPITDGYSCTAPPSPLPHDTEVVIFLEGAGTRTVRVMDGGAANILLSSDREWIVGGIGRVIEISQMETERARDLAMFGEVTSRNRFLHNVAHQYIRKIPTATLRDSYRAELMVLLKADDDARNVALQSIRFIPLPEYLPQILEAARSDKEQVLDSASLALGQHFVPEATSALIALTRHPNERIRARACIDLRDRRHAGALEAIVSLLADPVPKVRAAAAGGLVTWYRAGEALVTVPRVIGMLDDSSEEVQEWVAGGLGEAHDSRAVKPLLAVLRRKPLPERVERAVVQALSQIGSPDRLAGEIDSEALALINNEVPLFINILNSRRGASSSAVDILARSGKPEAVAALRNAAKTHSDQAVRQSSQWWLEKK